MQPDVGGFPDQSGSLTTPISHREPAGFLFLPGNREYISENFFND